MTDTPTTNTPIQVSLFRILADEIGTDINTFQASKATLVDISHTLEDTIIHNRLPSVIFTGFQESSHWREETERYLEMANIASQICIFAGGDPPVPEEKHIAVTLSGDDPLRQEWFVLMLTEHFVALLCGLDNMEDTNDEAHRTFATILTMHPTLVNKGVQAILPAVRRYRPDRAAELEEAIAQFPPRHPDGDYATRIITRIVDHLERRYVQQTSADMTVNQLESRQMALQQIINELAVPVVPLFEGVIVLPLVGSVDSQRAQQVMQSLLEGISAHHADVAILDITGVPMIDTAVANSLLQTVRAASLLGTHIIFTGISPQAAQSIVGLGLDFSELTTSSNLQTGIQIALARRGLQITPLAAPTQ